MSSNRSLDRVALYCAGAGTSFGSLASLFGLFTTLSKDEVHFFPFFCILTGCWGILAFIEAAIYVLFRNVKADDGGHARRESSAGTSLDRSSLNNVFDTSCKILLLHAVWFGGSFVCTIALYSIWNSQDLFQASGNSYSLANALLFGEIVLGVLPHFVVLGLYFYDRRRQRLVRGVRDGEQQKRSKKYKKSKSKAPAAVADEGATDVLEEESDRDDPYDSKAGQRGGASPDSDDEGDLEKQSLMENEQDDLGRSRGSEYDDESTSERADPRHGYRGEAGSSDLDENDSYGESTGQVSQRPDRPSRSASTLTRSRSRSRLEDTIHVESHRRDPRTGRDVVSEQDWNPDTNRYEDDARRRPPSEPLLPLSNPARDPSYSSTYPSSSRLYDPPASPPPQYSYPPTTATTIPYYRDRRPQYSPPVSPVFSRPLASASPPILPAISPTTTIPTRPIYVRPVSPPFYAPVVGSIVQAPRQTSSPPPPPPQTAYYYGPYYQSRPQR